MEIVKQILGQCCKSFHYRLIINNTSVVQNCTIYTPGKVSLNARNIKEKQHAEITEIETYILRLKFLSRA